MRCEPGGAGDGMQLHRGRPARTGAGSARRGAAGGCEPGGHQTSAPVRRDTRAVVAGKGSRNRSAGRPGEQDTPGAPLELDAIQRRGGVRGPDEAAARGERSVVAHADARPPRWRLSDPEAGQVAAGCAGLRTAGPEVLTTASSPAQTPGFVDTTLAHGFSP